jgi:hypothetical protein
MRATIVATGAHHMRDLLPDAASTPNCSGNGGGKTDKTQPPNRHGRERQTGLPGLVPVDAPKNKWRCSSF